MAKKKSKKAKAKNSINHLIIFVAFIAVIGIFLHLKTNAIIEGIHHTHTSHLITSTSQYLDAHLTNIGDQLNNRIEIQPFNIFAFFIFLCAICHTFLTHKFREIAHHIEDNHKNKLKADKDDVRFAIDKSLETDKSFAAEAFHFLGEVEVVFAIWIIPLLFFLTFFFDWHTAIDYLESREYTEPLFVIVIMTIASTRPIVRFAESCLKSIARLGNETPAAWWLTILTVGPILGSLISEPAAMTLSAMLLSRQFYDLKPSPKLSYATLGLLFTNISVGGVLTNFAAPPVLMVAKVWGWTTPFMALNYGWKAVLGIVMANALYFMYFRKDFSKLKRDRSKIKEDKKVGRSDRPIPYWVTGVHLFLLAWTVIQNHHPVLFIGSFLFFIAFYQASAPHQSILSLKTPILVGTFLAGLIIHGGLQGWWISAVLEKVSEGVLMGLAIVLTAFNDNAAITYLTSQIENFSDAMKYAVVAGAVTGGGLTVIANAPNPAGQAFLNQYFEDGISPVGLFLGAAIPTFIMAVCFKVL